MKANRIYSDWACSKYLEVFYREEVRLHYERNKEDLHGLYSECHAINSSNLKETFFVEDWSEFLAELCFWQKMNTQRLNSAHLRILWYILSFLPGNLDHEKGQLLGTLLIVEIKKIQTCTGMVHLYSLLDGDKLIVDYPYHEYCDLHDGAVLPEGKRKWKI